MMQYKIADDTSNDQIMANLNFALDNFGCITVKDVNDIFNVLSGPNDKTLGWKTSHGIDIITIQEGYGFGKSRVLYLPDPEYLNQKYIAAPVPDTGILLHVVFDKHGDDAPVLNVSIPMFDGSVKVMNLFFGDKAIDLYNQLVSIEKPELKSERYGNR